MSLKRGDIVLLPFPWTDLSSYKVRPALVVSDDAFNKKNKDAIFLFITSHKYTSDFDYYLDVKDTAFRNTGLKAASTFRMSKLMTLEQGLARRRLGFAEKKLMTKIESGLKLLMNL
jgi:mRNA interferase MazF